MTYFEVYERTCRNVENVGTIITDVKKTLKLAHFASKLTLITYYKACSINHSDENQSLDAIGYDAAHVYPQSTRQNGLQMRCSM